MNQSRMMEETLMSIRKTKLNFILSRRIPLLFILVGSAIILMTITTFASFDQQTVDQGKQVFDQNCIGCHTIGGGKLVGPDLKGVTALRDRQWLQEFISDPEAKFTSGDPIATQLLAEYNNIRMPNLGLTATEVDAVLLYIESASGSAQPQPTPTPSAIVGNAANGRKLFTGELGLTGGGTPQAAIALAASAGWRVGRLARI